MGPMISSPPVNKQLHFRGSLFKNGVPNVAADASSLLKLCADVSESGIDLSINFKKFTTAQTKFNQLREHVQKLSNSFDAYPAMRESYARAQQVAQADLQVRHKINHEILNVHEQRITALVDRLCERAHTDPRALEDIQRTVADLGEFKADLQKDHKHLDGELTKLLNDQNVNAKNIRGLETKLANEFVNNTMLRNELDQEKRNRRTLSSGMEDLQMSNDRLLEKYEYLRKHDDREKMSEIEELRAENRTMMNRMQEMQMQLAQLDTSRAHAGSQVPEEEQALKTSAETKSSDCYDKVSILWPIVVGDEEKQLPGVLDELNTTASDIKTEVTNDIKMEREITDQKINEAQVQTKQALDEKFTQDLNTNLNLLKSRLDKLENEQMLKRRPSSQSVQGEPSLEDVKKRLEMEQRIINEALIMNIASAEGWMQNAVKEQNKHIATLRVQLADQSAQQPLSASPSGMSSPTPTHNYAEMVQQLERHNDVLEDHRGKLEGLLSQESAPWRMEIQQIGMRLEENNVSEISDRLSMLSRAVLGPSYDIELKNHSSQPLIERITALTQLIPVMRSEMENEFKQQRENHIDVFQKFRENVITRLNNPEIITADPMEADSLKEMTEVPVHELAARKKFPRSRPLIRRPLINGAAIVHADQDSMGNVDPKSPATADKRREIPQTPEPNSERPPERPVQESDHPPGQQPSPPNSSFSKGPKRDNASGDSNRVARKRSVPDSVTSRMTPTARPQTTHNGRKRGHSPEAEGPIQPAKKHKDPTQTVKSPQKSRDQDPASSEDPADAGHAEGDEDDADSRVAPRTRRQKPETRKKASTASRPQIFDVPSD